MSISLYFPHVLSLTVLAFIPFGQCQCLSGWQEHQESHEPTNLTEDLESLHYLAETLSNDGDFEEHLDNILIPRPVNSTNHAKVENYIIQVLSDLGWYLEFNEFMDETPLGPMHFKNILAHSNPKSPRRLVIACHYETLFDLEEFVGAIDSGVPCAMLLNLARTLEPIIRAQDQDNPELSVTMLFFDGEEAINYWTSLDSTYGSRFLANKWASQSFWADGEFCQTSPATEMDRMDVLFLLDLIGASNSNLHRHIFLPDGTNPYYDMMMEIEQAMRANFPWNMDPILNGINSSKPFQFDPSSVIISIYPLAYSAEDDHTPFFQKGFRRIFYLIPRPFPIVWHSLADNKSNLDFSFISYMNKLLRIWTAQFLQYKGKAR